MDTLYEIRTNYEGIDVESGVYEFFTVESGQFDLVTDDNPDSDDIFILLNETSFLKPNIHFKTLEDVKIYLSA